MKKLMIPALLMALIGCGNPQVKMVAAFKGGEPQLDAESVEAPFTIEGSHLMRVNLLCNGREVPMTLDTGGITMMDVSLADTLGLEVQKLNEQMGVAPVEDIALGGAHVLGLKTSLMNFSQTFKTEKFGLHGLLGSDWLRHFCTTIDYGRGTLTFRQPQKLHRSGKGDHLLKMTVVMPYLPTVPAVVNGDMKLPALVDTGLHYGLVMPMSLLDRLPADQQAKAVPADGWFARWPFPGPTRSVLVRVGEVRIGDIVLRDQPVLFADVPQFLGENIMLLGKYFLDDYITTLDYKHRQVLLSETTAEEESVTYSFGFNVTSEGGVWSVCGLWHGSPAQSAGMALGDELLAVDGTPMSELPLGTLMARMVDPQVKTVTLLLRNADGERTVSLEKKELL